MDLSDLKKRLGLANKPGATGDGSEAPTEATPGAGDAASPITDAPVGVDLSMGAPPPQRPLLPRRLSMSLRLSRRPPSRPPPWLLHLP